MIKIKYLFWPAVISCFLLEAFIINFFDVIVLFPIRIVALLVLPVILLFPSKIVAKGTLGYASNLITFMIFYGLISLIWSPDPLLGLRQFTMVLTGAVIFLFIIRYANNLNVLKKIMIVWSIFSILASLLGFYETYSEQYIFNHVTDLGATDIESYRIWDIGWLTPRSFFPGPNEFAFFNAITSLILMGWAFEERGFYRRIAFIGSILSLILVINSFSRAAVGGLIIGQVVFIFTILSRARLVYKILMILFILFLSAYFLYLSQDFFNNNLAISLLKYKIENQDNSTRLFYATSALYNGTIGSLGFGKGLGASTEIIQGGSYHSYLLEILAEYGLWFFIGYLSLIAKVCIQLYSAIKKRRNIYWSGGILASCVAFPALCSGPASLLAIYPYWLWLALIVSYSSCLFNNIQLKTNN